MLMEEVALSEFVATKNMQWVIAISDISTLTLHTGILRVTTVMGTQRKTGAKVQTGLCSTTGHLIHIYWARSLSIVSPTVCNSS